MSQRGPYSTFLWPALAAASASAMGSFMAAEFLALSRGAENNQRPQEPDGVTPGKLALELNTVRLRDFTRTRSGVPTLLCTPFALHGAALADLAPGYSLVASLRAAGLDRLFMAEWRSASADMRYLGIDDYLASLNVLVDHVGGCVDLIGLCQGGWLSLVYASRFPAKVRKLVLVGAPIDVRAQRSELSGVTDATPLPVFQAFVKAGEGRVIGQNIATFWGNSVRANDVRDALQMPEAIGSSEFERLETVFKKWNSWTLDLPGTYYLEVIEKLYKRNELAAGEFVALGQTIDLSKLQLPMYLLAGSHDSTVAPEQLFALSRLGGNPENISCQLADSDHLGLFMGKRVLDECWPRIARWVREDRRITGERSLAAGA